MNFKDALKVLTGELVAVKPSDKDFLESKLCLDIRSGKAEAVDRSDFLFLSRHDVQELQDGLVITVPVNSDAHMVHTGDLIAVTKEDAERLNGVPVSNETMGEYARILDSGKNSGRPKGKTCPFCVGDELYVASDPIDFVNHCVQIHRMDMDKAAMAWELIKE